MHWTPKINKIVCLPFSYLLNFPWQFFFDLAKELDPRRLFKFHWLENGSRTQNADKKMATKNSFSCICSQFSSGFDVQRHFPGVFFLISEYKMTKNTKIPSDLSKKACIFFWAEVLFYVNHFGISFRLKTNNYFVIRFIEQLKSTELSRWTFSFSNDLSRDRLTVDNYHLFFDIDECLVIQAYLSAWSRDLLLAARVVWLYTIKKMTCLADF